MATAAAQDQRTALIVGASRGIGLGLAQELAARGWQVIATVRGNAPALAEAAKASGGRITVEHVEMTDAASVDALLAKLAGRRLDIALVNAGVSGPRATVDTVSAGEFGDFLMTNAVAPVRLGRRLLGLVPDGGVIAFMTSRLGSVAANDAGGMDLYRASKAALNTFTRSFAATDAKGRGVAVLSLHPGWVRTDMGGPNATLSVEESAKGLADVLEKADAPGHRFLDYSGAEIAW